jgi:hypothetical protein
MSNYADKILGASVNPLTAGESLSLRRILLEKGNAFLSTGSDNNLLYFCG